MSALHQEEGLADEKKRGNRSLQLRAFEVIRVNGQRNGNGLLEQEWIKLNQASFKNTKLPLRYCFGFLDRPSFLVNLSRKMTALYVSEFINNTVDSTYLVVPVTGTPQGASFVPCDNTPSKGHATIERHAALAFASGDGTSDAWPATLLSHIEDNTYSTVRYVRDGEGRLVKDKEKESQAIKDEAVDTLGKGFSDIQIIDVGGDDGPSHSPSPANCTSSARSHDVQDTLGTPLGLESKPISPSRTSPQPWQESHQQQQRDAEAVTNPKLYDCPGKVASSRNRKAVVVPPAAPTPREGSDADMSVSDRVRKKCDSVLDKGHLAMCKTQGRLYDLSTNFKRLHHGRHEGEPSTLGGVGGASVADPGPRSPGFREKLASKTKHWVLHPCGHQAHKAKDNPSRVGDAQSGGAHGALANASNPDDLQQNNCGSLKPMQFSPTQGNENNNDDTDNEHHGYGLPQSIEDQANAQASQHLDHMPLMDRRASIHVDLDKVEDMINCGTKRPSILVCGEPGVDDNPLVKKQATMVINMVVGVCVDMAEGNGMEICAEGVPQQVAEEGRSCDFVGGEVLQDAEHPEEEPSLLRDRSSSCPAKNMGAAGRSPLPPGSGTRSISFRDSLTTRALASTPFEMHIAKLETELIKCLREDPNNWRRFLRESLSSLTSSDWRGAEEALGQDEDITTEENEDPFPLGSIERSYKAKQKHAVAEPHRRLSNVNEDEPYLGNVGDTDREPDVAHAMDVECERGPSPGME